MRARRHRRSTTGACNRRPWSRTRPCSLSASRAAADTCLQGSGGRIRTCLSRLTVARLTDSTTPEQSGGSRIRTCGQPNRLRASNALPYPSAMPPNEHSTSHRASSATKPPGEETRGVAAARRRRRGVRTVEPAARAATAARATGVQMEPEGFEPSSYPRSVSGLYGEHPTTRNPPREHSPFSCCGPKPERKERDSNPQGREAHPFSRRGTAPVAVLPDGPGRDSNPHCTD